MNIVSLGMQNLKVWEFLFEGRSMTRDDSRRLEESISFLDRVMSAIGYFHQRDTEGLQESAFSEAYYACGTLQRLEKATNLPEVRSYLQGIRRSLVELLREGTLAAEEKQELAEFFQLVGNSFISEGMGQPPVIFSDDTQGELEESLEPPLVF